MCVHSGWGSFSCLRVFSVFRFGVGRSCFGCLSRFCLVLRVHLALCVVGWWVAPWVVSWFRAAVLAVFQCCFVDVVFFGCFASSFVGCRVGAASGLCQWVFGCVLFPVFDGSRLLKFSQAFPFQFCVWARSCPVGFVGRVYWAFGSCVLSVRALGSAIGSPRWLRFRVSFFVVS